MSTSYVVPHLSALMQHLKVRFVQSTLPYLTLGSCSSLRSYYLGTSESNLSLWLRAPYEPTYLVSRAVPPMILSRVTTVAPTCTRLFSRRYVSTLGSNPYIVSLIAWFLIISFFSVRCHIWDTDYLVPSRKHSPMPPLREAISSHTSTRPLRILD